MKKAMIFFIFFIFGFINLIAGVNEGLLAYYPFRGNANDESGNENHGIVYGAIAATDRFGNENESFYFDGVNDYIEIPKNLYEFGITNQFTVSIWIKSNNSPVMQMLLEDGTNWEASSFYLGVTPQLNQLFIRLNTDVSSFFCDSLSVTNFSERWILLSYIYDGTELKIYLDDSQVFTHQISGNVINGDRNLRIGFPSDESFYNGFIDDFRIYNRALTSNEIQELYLGLKANFNAPEIAMVGEEIQFTDTSTGSPTSWEWDFENDGIFDAFVQNPVHAYQTEGIYSIKLRIRNTTTVDSIIKENIISAYCAPAAPESLQIEVLYPDVLLSWSCVNTTECGLPIVPDGYIILYSEDTNQNEQNFYFLNFTNELSYIHTYIANFRDKVFYKIITVYNLNEANKKFLFDLNNIEKRISWKQVKEILKNYTEKKE